MTAAAPVVVAGNPFMRAQLLLGRRLQEVPGGWRLDGRPSAPRQVIAAANDVAAERGEVRIAYPGVAEVQRRVR